MARARIRMTGDKALLKRMRALPPKMQKRVARKGVNAATTPIGKAMRKAIGTMDEQTEVVKFAKKSIAKKSKTYPSGTAISVVGPKTRQEITRLGSGRVVNISTLLWQWEHGTSRSPAAGEFRKILAGMAHSTREIFIDKAAAEIEKVA